MRAVTWEEGVTSDQPDQLAGLQGHGAAAGDTFFPRYLPPFLLMKPAACKLPHW